MIIPDDVASELEALLEDMIQKRGPFNRDPLLHAHNIIEDFSDRATELKAKIWPQ